MAGNPFAPATLLSAPPTSRVGRYPKHAFNVRSRPFQIRPFCLAPVLPGESLTSAYFESRVVTDPIVNPIIGWKQEYYFFYVRMSDLLDDAIKEMFIDPTNTDISADYGEDSNVSQYYTGKGGVNWSYMCMDRVVKNYFRDSTEDNLNPLIDGLPQAQVKDTFFLDSLTDDSEMPEGDEIADATNAGDLERLMNAFEQLRAMGLTEMTYEDYLRSNGIAVSDPTAGKPELIWHLSDWQYPSNTIDPADGTPRSAVSWVFKNTLRKAKLFKEPGFIFGISIARPKIYFGGVYGSAAAHMTRAWDWMPALLAMTPETRLKHFGAGTGPLGERSGIAAGQQSQYWLDMCDILLHGDQWLDRLPAAGDQTIGANPANHVLPIPSWADGEDDLSFLYVGPDASKQFFVDSGESATKYFIKHDGVLNLSIKGKQIDMTVPRNVI